MNWAKELLELFGENGEHWTQGAAARNKEGKSCKPLSKDAICWCLVGGAEIICVSDEEYEAIIFELDEMLLYKRYETPTYFNDNNGFHTIKKFLEEISNELDSE